MKRSYLVRSVIVVLCLLISLWQTEFSLPLLWERGHYFIDTVGRMFPPDTSFLDVILVPLRDTVYISLLGTVFGGIIGAAGTVLCNGYVNQWKAVRIALKTAVHVFRCIPVLILALLPVGIRRQRERGPADGPCVGICGGRAPESLVGLCVEADTSGLSCQPAVSVGIQCA